MVCYKPTGCGDPNALELTQYCIFLVLYILILMLSINQLFKKFWGKLNINFSSAYILFSFIIILALSKKTLTLVRIVLCIDLWIDMD